MSQANVLVVSESFHTLPEAVKVLDESGCVATYVHPPRSFKEIAAGPVAESLAAADAVVMGRVKLEPAELDLAPRARVIALHTSGHDNIDIGAATERGVLVTNAKGVNADACADFTMGLILAATRQIPRGDRSLRAGRWFADTMESPDVSGATLGVIGLGLIGKALVKRAAAFDMTILAVTRTRDPDFDERYGVRHVSLETLLRESDIVSLNASLTPETAGMIGERELQLMKPSAVFVNIARGELVDEAALYRALSEGWIAAAGLDVYNTEPLHESPLFGLENAVLTPHQAGLTRSGKVRAAVRAARNALEVLGGRVPTDAVNPGAAGRWRVA